MPERHTRWGSRGIHVQFGTGTVLVANYRHAVALTTTPPLAVRIGGLRP